MRKWMKNSMVQNKKAKSVTPKLKKIPDVKKDSQEGIKAIPTLQV